MNNKQFIHQAAAIFRGNPMRVAKFGATSAFVFAICTSGYWLPSPNRDRSDTAPPPTSSGDVSVPAIYRPSSASKTSDVALRPGKGGGSGNIIAQVQSKRWSRDCTRADHTQFTPKYEITVISGRQSFITKASYTADGDRVTVKKSSDTAIYRFDGKSLFLVSMNISGVSITPAETQRFDLCSDRPVVPNESDLASPPASLSMALVIAVSVGDGPAVNTILEGKPTFNEEETRILKSLALTAPAPLSRALLAYFGVPQVDLNSLAWRGEPWTQISEIPGALVGLYSPSCQIGYTELERTKMRRVWNKQTEYSLEYSEIYQSGSRFMIKFGDDTRWVIEHRLGPTDEGIFILKSFAKNGAEIPFQSKSIIRRCNMWDM